MTFELALKDLLFRCETARADEALATGTKPARRKGLSATPVAHPDQDLLDLEELTISQRQEVRAMVTTMNKRHSTPPSASSGGGQTNASLGTVCLVKDCAEMCALPMCRLHFASMVCGKTPSHVLRNDYGTATYDKASNQAIYPAKSPADLLTRISRTGGKGGGGGGKGAGGYRGKPAGGR
jgi:hypothetical protein